MNNLSIQNNYIEVTKYNDGATYYTHKVVAVLPRCRKAVVISFQHKTKGGVIMRPLASGGSGEYRMEPKEYRELVAKAEVKPYVNYEQFEITEELERAAKEYHTNLYGKETA